MCGIVGYIVVDDEVLKGSRGRFFSEALFMDTVRGPHSTGMIQVSKNFQQKITKDIIPGYQFVESKIYKKSWKSPWAAIGHNRAATKGTVTRPNAHPFKFGPIRMVHNGTLDNMGANLPHILEPKPEVDSMAIAYNLSKMESKEATKILSRIRGSYALVWTDERDKSVNFARNDTRPLHFMVWNGEAMLFMSEAFMLASVVSRTLNAEEVPDIFQLTPMNHLKFVKGNLKPRVRKYVQVWDNYYNPNNYNTPNKNKTQKTIPYRPSEPRPMTVRIGDEEIILPKPYTENLKSFGLLPSDGLKFYPKEHVGWNNEIGHVEGEVEIPEWGSPIPAKVYGIYIDDWETNQKTNWCIEPLYMATIEKLEKGKPMHELCLIARKRWFIFIRQDELSIQGSVEERIENKQLLFYGPDNELIRKEKFHALTEDGCVYCSMPIYLKDHDEILWVGENGDDPLCIDCSGRVNSNGMLPDELAALTTWLEE